MALLNQVCQWTIVATLCLAASNVRADADKKDPGAVAFAENCAACHLPSGHGIEAMKAPSIAGLERWYVAYQLRRFRDGVRGAHVKDESGKLMRHVAERLDERQIAFLSRHVSNLPANKKRKTLKGGDAKRGKALFKDNCMSCHRFNASGERVFRSAPLTSQQDWYLLAQLKKFKAHQRGDVKGDALGPKMHQVTARIDFEADVPDLVAYIVSLPGPVVEEEKPDE